MTRKEAIKRFDALQEEHSATITAFELEQEIRLLEYQKRGAIASHKVVLAELNKRIETASKQLKDLK